MITLIRLVFLVLMVWAILAGNWFALGFGVVGLFMFYTVAALDDIRDRLPPKRD
jgi:hypothetical protein